MWVVFLLIPGWFLPTAAVENLRRLGLLTKVFKRSIEYKYERTANWSRYDDEGVFESEFELATPHWQASWFDYVGNASVPVNETLGLNHFLRKPDYLSPAAIESIVNLVPEGKHENKEQAFWESFADEWTFKASELNETLESDAFKQRQQRRTYWNKVAGYVADLPFIKANKKLEQVHEDTQWLSDARDAWIEDRDAILEGKMNRTANKYEPYVEASQEIGADIEAIKRLHAERLARKVGLEEINLMLMTLRNVDSKKAFIKDVVAPATVACYLNPACCDDISLCAPYFPGSRFY